MVCMRVVAFVLCVLASGCTPKPEVSLKMEEKPFVVQTAPDLQQNPYGATFEAQRLPDTVIPRVGSVASYKFVARNFKPDDRLFLYSQTLSGPLKLITEYQVDDDGTLARQVSDGTMILDNDVWLMFDFFRGEPVRYWLISKDKTTSLSCKFIPYPIVAKGRDGATIELCRLIPDAKLVICEGEGFLPDEELYVTSKSANKMIANVPVQCPNGKFSITFEPCPPGKTGGAGFVEIKRQNERLILEYDWGSEATSQKKRIACSALMEPGTLQKMSEES